MEQCYCLGVEDLEQLSPEELHMPTSYLITLNGLILVKHKSPQVCSKWNNYISQISASEVRLVVYLSPMNCYFNQRFANAMRRLRRAGKVGEFVSIFVNEKQVI